jgi:hypothetical protein
VDGNPGSQVTVLFWSPFPDLLIPFPRRPRLPEEKEIQDGTQLKLPETEKQWEGARLAKLPQPDPQRLGA